MDRSEHIAKTDGSGIDRSIVKKLRNFYKSRIYEKNNRAIIPNGLPFQFEIMTHHVTKQKLLLPFKGCYQAWLFTLRLEPLMIVNIKTVWKCLTMI